MFATATQPVNFASFRPPHQSRERHLAREPALQVGQVIQRGQRPLLFEHVRHRMFQAGLDTRGQLHAQVERKGRPAVCVRADEAPQLRI